MPNHENDHEQILKNAIRTIAEAISCKRKKVNALTAALNVAYVQAIHLTNKIPLYFSNLANP
jgi:hypothetical protein